MTWQEFSAVLRRFPVQDQEKIQRAFQLGETMHAPQKRHSGEPYFSHPITVARILIDWWADADTVVAALLHDTVEDTPLTLADVEKQFGHTVSALVEGVTKLSAEEMGEKPTLDQQIETLRKIFNLMQQDVRIMVIKLADRLHNMRTSQFLRPEKRLALARETLEVYVRIADRLCMYDIQQELDALCMQTLEPELFERLDTLQKESEVRAEKIAMDMRSALREHHEKMLPGVEIVPEQKSWRRLRQQLEAEGAAVTGVSAITVVYVCPDIDSCYSILGALHQLWKRETLSFQDFINSPQINGYRGLHTTIILSDGTRVRCKIRTQEMHRYAQQGITTLCFDPTTEIRNGSDKGILKLLPWTKRISPLTEDTKDRSQEFWGSLQSDILGESIVIHGPSDETVHIPSGATALDGAFYLLKDLALRSMTIKVNGREVPFQTLLKHGDSLDVSINGESTAQREWLMWTNTGLATAYIRRSLSLAQPEENKIAIGKTMLQRIFLERGKGFIEEFDEPTLSPTLLPLGFTSLSEAYSAIADGRADATTVFTTMFATTKQRAERQRPSIITYSIDMDNLEIMDRINRIHRSLAPSLQEIRYRRRFGGENASVTIRTFLGQAALDALTSQLSSAGASDLNVAHAPSAFYIPSIIGLFLLWGLDPVFSKVFLDWGVAPMSFVLIRAVSVFLFSLVILIWTRQLRSFARISISAPSLWVASLAFFLIGLFTYAALEYGSPSLYSTVFRANAVILSTPLLLQQGAFGTLGSSIFLSLVGFLSLLLSHPTPSGLMLSFLVLLSFSIYTFASRRFQRSARVLARYPQFLSFTSAIAVMGAISSYMIFPSPLPSLSMTLILATYCICFIGIPYILFYTLTRAIGYSVVSPWIHLSIVATFIGEAIVFGISSGTPLIIAAFLLTIGSLIASRRLQAS